MDTAIVSLLCIALIVFGGMTMSQGFLTSVDSTTGGLESLARQEEQVMRTGLSSENATMESSSQLSITLRNTGQEKLYNFDRWDVIVHYHDGSGGYHIKWLPYNSGAPSSNEWAISGIYMDGQPEVFEPGILNPGEDMVIEAVLDPSVGDETTNRVVVSTDKGKSVSLAFYGLPSP